MAYIGKFCPNCETEARINQIVQRPYYTCTSCKQVFPVQNLVPKQVRSLSIGGPGLTHAPTIDLVASAVFIDGTAATTSVDSSQFILTDKEQLLAVVWSRNGSVNAPTVTLSPSTGQTYTLTRLVGQARVASATRVDIFTNAADTTLGPKSPTAGYTYYGNGTDYLTATWGSLYPTSGGIQVFKISQSVSTDVTTGYDGFATTANLTIADLSSPNDLVISANVYPAVMSGSTTTWNYADGVFPLLGNASGGTNASSCSVAYKRLLDKSQQTISSGFPLLNVANTTIALKKNR